MREEIIKKTVTELVYVANDGTVFKNKRWCESYEKELKLNKEKVINSRIETMTFNDENKASLFLVENEADIEILIEYLKIDEDEFYTDFNDYGNGWYIYWTDCGFYNLLNYNVYINELLEEVKNFERKNNNLIIVKVNDMEKD